MKTYIIKQELNHQLYKDTLIDNEVVKRQQNMIRSKKHEFSSITQEKTALCPYDDKRYIKDDVHMHEHNR